MNQAAAVKIGRTVLIVMTVLFLALQVIAIFQVSFVSDEPDDLFIIQDMLGRSTLFFDDVYSPHQARFPMLLSIPILFIFQQNYLVPLRLFFLIFHFLYLVFSYKLISEAVKNEKSASAYYLLVLTSCFLTSFSVFSGSAGESLYLFFHLMSIYLFYQSSTEEKETGVFRNHILLACFFGACIASKLFGMFLLLAVILFHFFTRRKIKNISVESPSSDRMMVFNGIWITGLLLVNFTPIPDMARLILSISLAFIYLGFLGFLIFRSQKQARFVSVSRWKLWLSILLTAFCVTLCFSPIYLNLKNIIAIFFSASGMWEEIIGNQTVSVLDLLVLMVLKFGLISSVVSLAAVIWGLASLRRRRFGEFTALIIFIAVIHFGAIILMRKAMGTWWVLAIFPFLYLPVAWLWTYAAETSKKWIWAAALIFLLVITGDNVYRYLKWFPFGHFDGAQYGNQFIGSTKAGFVSFEAIPFLYEELKEIRPDNPAEKVMVNCQLIPMSLWNRWAANLIEDYFELKKQNSLFDFYEASGGLNDRMADLVLSSPIYHPKIHEILSSDARYQLLKTVSLKGINIVSIWKPRKETF